METVRPQGPQLSPNMFIIKPPQATIIPIILHIMTRATIIILLRMHGQAHINTHNIQAILILGKVLIIQEIGLAHSITIKAPTIQSGKVNLIAGRALITRFGRTAINHHGQTVLLIIGLSHFRFTIIIRPQIVLAITIPMTKAIKITTTTITTRRNRSNTQSMIVTLAA